VVDAGGGSSITFTGTNLSSSSAFTFGVTAGTITGNTSTTVTVTTPAKTASATPVDCVVTTPLGSATLPAAVEFFAPENIANIWFDWETDANVVVTGSGGTYFVTWTDKSVGAHQFVSPAPGTTNSPAVSTVGGKPSLHFTPVQYLTCTTLGTPTAAESFRVAIQTTDVAPNYQAIDSFGGGGNCGFPDSTDKITDTFGSSATHVSDSTGYQVKGESLYCLERQVDAAGNWRSYLNGQRVTISTGNTVAWPATALIGKIDGNGGTNDVLAMGGYQTRTLTTAERKRYRAWVSDKYGIAMDHACSIRGYGHSVAYGGNASSVGTTDMYPRTIQALQAAAPGRYNLTYLGHPGEHVAQWMGEIATDITAYYVDGEVNILCMIELFNSISYYNSINPSWTATQLANQTVADTIAWCAAVKAAKPWLIVLYMTYKPFGFFGNATLSAALDQTISQLVALVGAGNIDAVVRLDQDATLDAGFQTAPPNTITNDGTHPLDPGHQLIANDTVPVIEALYAANA